MRASFGTFLGLASPIAAEVAAVAGVDWLLLDLEHGGSGEEQIGAVVTAAGAYGVPTLVRVENSERIRIGRALDAGAAGVMVPRLETAEQVRDAVRHMAYPPAGDRGVATYNRSVAWGSEVGVLTAPRAAVCIVQIETLGALNAVQEIASIGGVDVLFVGPLDLSVALGVPRDFSNPIFLAALAHVVQAAQSHDVTAGILAIDAAAARKFEEMGFRFIAIGSDSTLLAAQVRSTMSTAIDGRDGDVPGRGAVSSTLSACMRGLLS
jgi:2-dehydro-3-deoxyglucarate aldolase/4-hydroxy-2-oxoheptanedioate aldolase